MASVETTKYENFVSPMPSLNATPDAGWATWGNDPSKIKKEEEQVVRAAPTHAQSGRPQSNTSKSPSIISRNGPIPYANGSQHPSVSPPPNVRHHPAQANGRNGSLPGRESWQPNSKPYPVNYQVRLPGQQQRLYTPNPITREAVPGNSSLSMRPPQIPVTYTSRPIFQYGKNTTTPKPLVSVANSLTSQAVPPPLALAESTSTSNGHTSHPPAQPSPSTHWKVLKPAGTIELPSYATRNGHGSSSVLTSPTSTLSKAKSGISRVDSGSTAVAPTILEHSTITNGEDNQAMGATTTGIGWGDLDPLARSTSGDSGHASVSSGPPSTFQPSTAPSTGPKVHLPSIEQRTQQHHLPSTAESSIPKEPSPFLSRHLQVHIPKSLPLAKAIRALDIDSLKALAEDKMKVELDLTNRLVRFEVISDIPSAWKVCVMCIEVAASAMREACAPDSYELQDDVTRRFLVDSFDEKIIPPVGKAEASETTQVETSESPPQPQVEIEQTANSLVDADLHGKINESFRAQDPTETGAWQSRTDVIHSLPHANQHPSNAEYASNLNAGHLLSLISSYGSAVPVEADLKNNPAGITVEGSITLPPTSSATHTQAEFGIQAGPTSALPSHNDLFIPEAQTLTTPTLPESSDGPVSSQDECEDPQDHPFIRRSTRFNNLLELSLRIPEHVYDNTVKLCRLHEHVPLQSVYYNRNNKFCFLRHGKIANLELARTVLLVILQLVDPTFPPLQAIFKLEEGSSGQQLANTLRSDRKHPMRKANLDQLTAYIVDCLRSAEQNRDQAAEGASAVQEAVTAAHLAEHSLDESTMSGQNTATNVLPVIEKSACEPVQLVTKSRPSPDLSDSRPSVPNAVNYGTLSCEELQDRLTEDNSICWFLPSNAGRHRFVGPGGCNLKAIRGHTEVCNLFWRSDIGQTEDWYLIIVGGDSPVLTNEEEQKLAYAFRLCKAWAIAVNAEDMLPTSGDIPQGRRYDANFRLSEYELLQLRPIFHHLRHLSREELLNQFPEALSQLAKYCERHGQPPATIAPNKLRAALVEELCTDRNSICWTARGRDAGFEIVGDRGSHFNTMESMFEVAAIKIDVNESRYGKDACRICILACNKEQANKTEEQCLSRAFRTIIALIGVLGHESLLPSEENLSGSSLGLPLLRFGLEDRRKATQAVSHIGEPGLSTEKIRLVASILFPLASVPKSPANISDAQQQGLNQPYASSQSFDRNSSVCHPQGEVHSTAKQYHSSSSILPPAMPVVKLPLQINSQYDSISESAIYSGGQVDKAASLQLQNDDDDFAGLYVAYNSIRDIPGFERDCGPIEDGYIATQEEPSLYEDLSSTWSILSHRKRLEFIGSAYWATARLREVLKIASVSRNGDHESIGPSASRLGAGTDDGTAPHGHPGIPGALNDTSGWETAYEQDEAAQAVLPRVKDWAQGVAHHAGATPKTVREVSRPVTGLPSDPETGESAPQTSQPVLFLPLPNDHALRNTILGDNDELLQKVALHTGASVHLAPGNTFLDNYRPVWISGKDDSVARALQMLANAVRTHVPAWRFPADIECVIDMLNEGAKEAETKRLAADSAAQQDRWTVAHMIFVPEEALHLVAAAISLGKFITDCASVKVDPVMTGKVTVDAPTCNQSDAALIKICDIVRQVIPGWRPDNQDARAVIEEADRNAGPGVKTGQPAQLASAEAKADEAEEQFRLGGLSWQPTPASKKSRCGPSHIRKTSKQSSTTMQSQSSLPARRHNSMQV